MDTIQKIRREVREALSGIRHVLLILSGKGGVGKSTVAVNLARGLARKGYKVGLMDTDVHGPDVLVLLGLEPEGFSTDEGGKIIPRRSPEGIEVVSLAENLSPDEAVIWRGPLKISLIRQFLSGVKWGEKDFLVIDSPPGTGDEPLTVMQFLADAISGAIIVTTANEVALADTRRSVSFARKMGIRILGLVENMGEMICPNCSARIRLFGSKTAEEMARELGVDLLAAIPFSPELIDALKRGESAWDRETAVRSAYEELIDGVLSAVGGR